MRGVLAKLQKDESKFGPLARLVSTSIPEYKIKYTIVGIAMALQAAATAGSAYVMKYIINNIFIEKQFYMLFIVSFSIIGIYAVKGFSTYISGLTLNRIGNNMIARTQMGMFDALMRQDVQFFSRNTLGEMVTRITQNAQAARSALEMVVMNMGRGVITLISLLAVMIVQNPLMSLIAFVIMPPAVYGVIQLIRKVRLVARREVQSLGMIVSLVQQSVQGVRIVKAFGLEDRLRTAMARAIGDVESQSNRIASLNMRTGPMMETLGGCAIAIVVMYGGYDVIVNNGNAGSFFTFITALLMAYEPAKDIARLNVELEGPLVGVRMMYEVLDAVPAFEDSPHATEASFTDATLELRHVSFGYNETPVLRGLSLVAPVGQVVALVGPSGAGKSTVFALIERFFDPGHGSVVLNGHDIRDYTMASLRRHIALVTQDTFLFDGTVAENIADGRPGAPMSEIIAAARDANAFDFIMAMPGGFAARVEGGGTNMSGGQRQRIAIARAILRAAPILLLDEATSALDSQAEAEIQEALARLMKGRTTIVIAHRLATVRDADIIYVMDHGEVKQSGTHAQLLAEGGLYAHLYNLQFRDEAAKEAAEA